MKRTLLCILSVLMALVVKAGDVTPEVAMKQAADFVKQRVANGSRRAPSASQLTMTKKVSGLYVFNVGNREGFVIVSPDDRTEAILGYSDSGDLNPDNMPDNMKAWLQGYADEIAWAERHHITASATATQRAHRAVKTAIAPLVTTHWDQDEPYNNQCPAFFSYGQSVTGCVATAMAQVLYYTAKTGGATSSATSKDIPAYTCRRNWTGDGQISVPAIPAGTTLNWSMMKDTYASNETGDAADAVATLMKVCGASVGMDYSTAINGGSTSSGANIPNALKNYFTFISPTATIAERSQYSYRNWIDLIYNELSQRRAIIYSGQSTGGGHSFVCDGYQDEDYFHINWGWGGKSDSYFKLSALDSKQQGIGGSSSSDGYNTGQNAIVGMQLTGGTGTVLDNATGINLTLNSISVPKTTMTTDETLDITFNVTNNNSVDYDGEVGIWIFEDIAGDGKMFYIPAGESKDCVVPFKPKSTGEYKITAYKPVANASFTTIDKDKSVTITVKEGSGTAAKDNVELSLGDPVVENTESYQLYGNLFKATIRLTNTSTEKDYRGQFLWQLIPYSYEGGFTYNSVIVNVPKNSYIDVPMQVDGLNMNEAGYRLYVAYIYNGVKQGDANYGYALNPAIITLNADGTKTVTKPSGTTFNTPSTALSVDLSGTGITTVSKNSNSNPNCLYILKTTDTTPAGLTNVIKFDGTSYSADAITLTDGYDFQSPVDFTATTIEFTFANDRWADGTNGWNTIMLPFNVSEVTANGTAIDWFKSSSDTGKQFWLKEFTSDEVGEVNFSFATAMKANTPYIIALPGDHWGAAYNLNGKTIKFKGSGTITKSGRTTVTAEYYRFMGQTQKNNTENIYCINAAGNKFELKTTGGSPAFRPYFKADIFDRTTSSLAIGFDETTGIKSLTLTPAPIGEGSDVIYDLQGRRIGQWSTLNSQLRPGLYIINGKKVIIKK